MVQGSSLATVAGTGRFLSVTYLDNSRHTEEIFQLLVTPIVQKTKGFYGHRW